MICLLALGCRRLGGWQECLGAPSAAAAVAAAAAAAPAPVAWRWRRGADMGGVVAAAQCGGGGNTADRPHLGKVVGLTSNNLRLIHLSQAVVH